MTPTPPPHADDLALAARCQQGLFEAWEELIDRLKRPLHTLVVRFVWSVHDAEDVTQEVLLKVVTALHSYRGDAALTTWAYRIASRHLIDLRRRPAEDLTFDRGREHLLEGLKAPEWSGPERAALAQEVKIGCSTSMLMCLSRPLRLSYLLGAVLDLPGPEASWVLEVDPTVHRKRLSLAREKVRGFMAGICGLYDPKNPCRCARQISEHVRIGRIDPAHPDFASRAVRGQALRLVGDLDALADDLAIMRSNPEFEPSGSRLVRLRQLLSTGNLAG